MSTEKSYFIMQIVGTSKKSIEDAIQNAITDAEKDAKNIRWFEVIETRGHVEAGKIQHFQVTVKLGYTK